MGSRALRGTAIAVLGAGVAACGEAPRLSLPAWPWVLLAVAAVLITGALAALVRSPAAKASLAFRRLRHLPPDELGVGLSHLVARLARSGDRGNEAVLVRLAHRLSRLRDRPRARLARLVEVSAPLLRWIGPAGAKVDTATRRAIADVLDERIAVFDELSEESAAEGDEAFSGQARLLGLQDRLFGGLLRAESPGHLAALREELSEIDALAVGYPGSPFVSRELLSDLRGVLEGQAQLQRLPNAEDKALFLGQSLTQTLEAQERWLQVSAARPAFSLMIGGVALDSLRQILATALRDLSHRAQLALELRSKVLATRREAVVVLEIQNVGQGHAQNVIVHLEAPDENVLVLQPRQYLKSLLRQQSARLEFLVEPRVSQRVRMTFYVFWDDLERRGQRREFADAVQFRPVAEPRTFVPLKPNPYVVGRPLLEEDLFIGREELFERLVSNFRGANQDNVVVLIGQRRMGKTSILRRLHYHLPETYVTVLVDLQGLYGSGEPTFFREVAATICDALEDRGIAFEEPPPELFETDPGSAFRRRFLKAVRGALGERRLLLLFDEFEVLEQRIRRGELSPQILPYFRSLVQHEDLVSFLFAGTHRLDELTRDYWSVLFNLAVYLEVGHLSEAEVAELFSIPAETFEMDPLALTKVYQFTGGHPHFSQLVARELVDFRNRRRLVYLTVQDVNAVAGIVADKGQLHIAYLWDEATRDERLLLLALEQLRHREGVGTVAAAHRYLSEHGAEPGDLPAAAQALLRREILLEHGGQLSLRMGLLRLWMERHHDLESFLLSDGRDGLS